MAAFQGFPDWSQKTPVPNLFFSGVLPLIDDLVELKVTLHVFWLLALKKGPYKFTTAKELGADLDLMSGLALEGKDPGAELRRGLERATARGTLLRLDLEKGEGGEELYFINTPADQRVIEQARRGQIDLGAMPKAKPLAEAAPAKRTIFELYERNIGMLTPLIAEELKEAETEYPAEFIEEAFREAVRLNKRSWRYIQRILENWRDQGRFSGKHQGRSEKVRADQQPRAYTGGYVTKRRG
jgi:DnaD/phage-associated family protein